ncbi:uncharacterized protein YcfJ [Luteimonas cucumeris]|uniref:Uncharacterized protein YcfJ n=2 Tax=Luteimonas cucumeris TaxID=985012 RepID=A0A562L7I9_9GAMM|nr:hypothetical protein [Luteimonas cucumeris]TWI03588.1 uncharacterized protein YcfJ [Luteimonas cucumeris]
MSYRTPRHLLLILAFGLPGAAMAQGTQMVVIHAENVRTDYARVLRVEPVYETLRATRMEHHCEAPGGDGEGKGLSRVVGAVKDALTPSKEEPVVTKDGQECRLVPVEREFKRKIGYDVDYVYKGSKYRSRLDRDPGRRLRIRVSVTPNMPGSGR